MDDLLDASRRVQPGEELAQQAAQLPLAVGRQVCPQREDRCAGRFLQVCDCQWARGGVGLGVLCRIRFLRLV